eukprot:s299_g32.t1
MLPVLLLLVQASAILLPSSSPSESQSAGCQYRKVFLHQASLLDTSEPLEGWLTLDGKPCNPSSRFHWRPPVVAPTVTYAPVEVSKWASAADEAVGNAGNRQINRAHQKEFLKSQGIDVTEDEIREALRITTTPPVTTVWTTTVSDEIPEGIPAGILEGYSPGHISVNVTDADRFVHDARMMQKIKEILANRTGLDPNYFRINYTKLHDGTPGTPVTPVTGFLQVARALPLDVVEAGITASIPESDKKAAEKWQSVKENDLYKAVQDAYREMVHEDRLAVHYSPTPTDAETVAQVVSRLQESASHSSQPPTTALPAAQPAVAAAPAEAKLIPSATTAAPEVLNKREKEVPDVASSGADAIAAAPAQAVDVKEEVPDVLSPAHSSSAPAKVPLIPESNSAKAVETEVEKLGDKLDTLTKKISNVPHEAPTKPTPVQRQINNINEKMEKLSEQISQVGKEPLQPAPKSSPVDGYGGHSGHVDAQIHEINEKMDSLSNKIKRVGRKTETLEDLNHAHTWKLEDIDSKVDQLAKKLGDPKVEHMQSLRGKIDHLLKSVKEADESLVNDVAASPASAVSGRPRSRPAQSVESVAPSPAAAPMRSMRRMVPAVDAVPIASQAALAPQAARGEVTAAPTEAKLVPSATTVAAEVPVVSRSSAPVLSPVRTVAPSIAQAPAAAVAMSPAQAPPAQAAEVVPVAAAPAQARGTDTLSAEARSKMEQIEDKIDKLGERFKRQASSSRAVAKAQEPSKAFMNSQVAQVAKVELMDVKTDVQQEILTHALDGKAQMQGQVEAADHRRKEILQKLNVTMQKRLSEARASLDDAESQVSETARHVVQEVVGNVSAEAAHVAVVGTDAEKLKMEAESLQNNISALLSHVEQDSGLAAEIVTEPSRL